MARIGLGQAFCDPRTGWTPQVPLLREQLSDTSESPLSGAVLPILQLGKLRLPKLSWHPNPRLSHCGACVLLGVCVCVCARTPQALLSAPWAGMSRLFGRGSLKWSLVAEPVSSCQVGMLRVKEGVSAPCQLLGPQPPSSSASFPFLQNKHPRAQTAHPAKAQMEPELELISPVARATRTWTEDPAFCLSPPPPARPHPCLSRPRPPRPWLHPLHLQQLAVPGGREDGDV